MPLDFEDDDIEIIELLDMSSIAAAMVSNAEEAAEEAVDALLEALTGIENKEDAIAPGTVDQVWQGNKTWIDKVGLPISTATQAGLNALDTDKLDISALDSTLAGKSAASTGISTIFGLNAAGNAVVKANRAIFNVKDYGAVGDNSTDDTAAILAARTALVANGGGVLYFPKTSQNRYKCASTIQMSINGFHIEAESKGCIIDFATQASGPGIALGGIYDWSIKNFAVLNAYGACVEINRGTITGPQTYCGYGLMSNVVLRGARNSADNLEIGNCYQCVFEVVRSQEGVRKGIAIFGFCTTLTFISCHAFDAADDNWQIKNIVYSVFMACGSDNAGGYGYSLQDADIEMIRCGCETAEYSAIEVIFDNTSTSTVKGMNIVLDGFNTLNNNVAAHAGSGWLATTSGSPASTAAGHISISNLRDLGTPAGNAIEGNGAFTYGIDQRSQKIINFGSAPGFSWVGDGVTDVPATGPVNISGANTRIATLRPKLRNGTAAYGGLLVVTVAQNNRSAGSRTATYVLAVNKASAGTIGEISVISSIGNDAGANAADASFTFTFDSANDELEATVAGSTATGNWYFHIACIGNLSAVIG